MIRFVILACFLGAAAAAPSDLPRQARTKEEVEEFRTYLENTRTNNFSLDDAMARYPWASPWENSGKFQGDILLTEEQIEDLVSEYANPDDSNRMATRRSGGLWPGRVIVYQLVGQFNANQLNMIQRAINFFHTRTCIRFRRRTNENTFVRVTRYQSGCWANVGHFANRVTGMNLDNWCFNNLMIIIHEWLHVAGFYHMHMTHNRYHCVGINWNNIQQGVAFAFYRFNYNQIDNLRLPYEYASNMHYGARAFSRNGQPTIVARRAGGHMMGQTTHITGWDIMRAQRLYGCPGAWTRSFEEPYYPEEAEQEQPLEQQPVMEQEQVLEQDQGIEQEQQFEEK